jgi:hypothetical protein
MNARVSADMSIRVPRFRCGGARVQLSVLRRTWLFLICLAIKPKSMLRPYTSSITFAGLLECYGSPCWRPISSRRFWLGGGRPLRRWFSVGLAEQRIDTLSSVGPAFSPGYLSLIAASISRSDLVASGTPTRTIAARTACTSVRSAACTPNSALLLVSIVSMSAQTRRPIP